MPITAPTLAIQDSADDGGFVATITGGDPSADNLLKVARYTNALQSSTWEPAGIMSGPGIITDSLDDGKGYYLWHVESSLGGETVLSNVVNQPLTSGADALHEQIIAAVAATVELLALPGIAAVYRRKVTWPDLLAKQLEFPCVVVSTFNQSETALGGTNAQDDVGRPVYVLFITTEARSNINEARWHLWREMVRHAFQSQRLAGVPDVMTCEVQAATVVEADERMIDWQFGGYQLMFHTREGRGFGGDPLLNVDDDTILIWA